MLKLFVAVLLKGKTFLFKLKIEDEMLHQFSVTIELHMYS